MSSLTTTLMALALSLCAPVAVYANDSATKVHHSHVYQRVAHYAIPNNATALSPTVARERETDGLSRDHEDCNMGCIDN
jgi:hypothetical protein